jgi:hypothetical protein
MRVEEHEPLERLRELSKQQKRAREHRRFRAVVLAPGGGRPRSGSPATTPGAWRRLRRASGRAARLGWRRDGRGS